MRSVQLDPVVPGTVEIFGGVRPAVDERRDVVSGRGAGFAERHAHCFLQLDGAGGDGVRLDPCVDLSARVVDLRDDEGAVLLCGGGEVAECLESFTRERSVARDDRVAQSFEVFVVG